MPSTPLLVSRHLGAVSTDCTRKKLGVLRVDLTIESFAAVTQATVDEIDRMIDALDALRATALDCFAAALVDATSEHDQVAKLWEFHHDEVDPSITRDRFVAALDLVRAGFYPAGRFFVVLDFVVRGPKTDQLLVASFRRDGSLDVVSWES